jgi:hypothetical protein
MKRAEERVRRNGRYEFVVVTIATVSLGIVLVELIAAVADLLSAYQEKVGDEAYIGDPPRER